MPHMATIGAAIAHNVIIHIKHRFLLILGLANPIILKNNSLQYKKNNIHAKLSFKDIFLLTKPGLCQTKNLFDDLIYLLLISFISKALND